MRTLQPDHIEVQARAAVSVVSATFGTMSYFALDEVPPLSEPQEVLSLLSHGAGGGGGTCLFCFAGV